MQEEEHAASEMLQILRSHAQHAERDSINEEISRYFNQNVDTFLERHNNEEPIIEMNENGFMSDSEEFFDYDTAMRN